MPEATARTPLEIDIICYRNSFGVCRISDIVRKFPSNEKSVIFQKPAGLQHTAKSLNSVEVEIDARVTKTSGFCPFSTICSQNLLI